MALIIFPADINGKTAHSHGCSFSITYRQLPIAFSVTCFKQTKPSTDETNFYSTLVGILMLRRKR